MLNNQDQMFWNTIKENLKAKNSSNKLLQTWFEPTILKNVEERSNGKCFLLGVPNELHKYWISENLLDRICQEISGVYGGPFQVELIITGESGAVNQVAPAGPEVYEPPSNSITVEEINKDYFASNPKSPDRGRDKLNTEYLFSTFVVGRNNEFAHAACYNIAEKPGIRGGYNPLFISGPTGMGKTHLLNAVGNHIRHKFPEYTITYISAERFMNDCISALRHRKMDEFRKTYRGHADVFLVDDIQILGRGEAVQEEFFYTLNDLLERDKQVVVASDRMPKDINGLADRIRTRLEWGVIADIQMPDLETRTAILRYKAEQKGIKMPEDVISFIAKISKRSIRELEGNLNKLKMYTELQGLPINLDLAKKVLANHASEASAVTIQDIQKMVSEHYKVKLNDLKSSNRSKPLVVARQAAMFLTKKHLDKSLQDIGRAFGGKDHSTVINAIKRIESQLVTNSDLRKDIDELQNRIHNLTGL
ncbi:MAG: chromosomal replication initiator protein DnaA [Bdellovibrionota bacterium]|nr:chromosomal replication initiator protein DnaA [Bdellovibrionota bacterium]